MQEIKFSADGIRGIADQWPLTPDGARKIGCALGQFVRQQYGDQVVVIGRDTRSSGNVLVNSLKTGLLSQGVDVVDVEIMPTPGVAYLTTWKKATLGIIVSASHSPAKYNGIKLVGEKGWRLTGKDEAKIKKLIKSTCNENLTSTSLLSSHETDSAKYVKRYIQKQIELCQIMSPIERKLVIDCANGATLRVAPRVFKRLGAVVAAINTRRTGDKINHQCGSEWTRLDPHYLISIVQEKSAAYGIAFDGDGDRLVIVDDAGNTYNGDDFLFVLATYFKRQNLLRGDTVVTTDMANTGLEEALRLYGIEVVRTKNGDKNLEKEILTNDYYLGAEQIGNVIIHDGCHTAADSLYAALVLMSVVQKTGKELGQLVMDFQKRPQVRATITLVDVPPWVKNKIPSKVATSLDETKQHCLKTLGQDSRVIAWRSSTEPEFFNVMVEGGRRNTLEQTERAAIACCETVRQILKLEPVEPAMFYLSQRRM